QIVLGARGTEGAALMMAGGRMDGEEVDPRPFHHGIHASAAGGLDGDRHRTATEALLEFIEPAMEGLSGVSQMELFDGLIVGADGDSMPAGAPIKTDESGPLDGVWRVIGFHRWSVVAAWCSGIAVRIVRGFAEPAAEDAYPLRQGPGCWRRGGYWSAGGTGC